MTFALTVVRAMPIF